MAETWVIKDNAPVDEASYVLNRTNVLFTSGGKEFIAVEILDDGAVVLGLTYYGSDDKVVQPAFLRYGDGETQFYWNAPAYKTLEFDTAPTGEFLAWLTKNADKQSDTEYLTRKSELTLVANAIRTKTGSAAQISFPDGYVTEISTLTNTSADTVTADKLLEGTTAHDKSGKQITGTMGELHGLAYTGGAITTPGSGGSYSIPASYIPEDTRYVKGNDETVVNVTIPKTKFGDATAADVVKGKDFSSAEGIAKTGSMEPLTQLAYQNKPVTRSNNLFIFPCSNSNDERCYLEGENSMDVSVGINAMKFGEASPAEVLKGKTFSSNSGIAQTGTYVPLDTSDATATASDIAKKKTAYVNGTKVTGTVETVGPGEAYGTATPSVRVSGNYIMAEDELREDFLLRKDSLIQLKMDPMKFGLAQNEEVLAGKSFTSMVGFKATGTMPNNGAAAIQLSDLTAKPVTAGYYSGGTAKVADAEAAKIIPENIKKGVTILGVTGTAEGSSARPVSIAIENTDFTEVWVGYVMFNGSMTGDITAQGQRGWISVEEGSEIVVVNTAFDGEQIDLVPDGGFITQKVSTSNVTAFIVDYSLNGKIVELLLK